MRPNKGSCIIPTKELWPAEQIKLFDISLQIISKNTSTMVSSLQYHPIAIHNIRAFYIKICTINTVTTPLICRNNFLELMRVLSIMLTELAIGSFTKIIIMQDVHHPLLILFIGLVMIIIGDCYLIMESLVFDLLFVIFESRMCSKPVTVDFADGFFNQKILLASSIFDSYLI